MKKLLIAAMLIIIAFTAKTQSTGAGQGKVKMSTTPQQAHFDAFLKIEGVDGESGDSLPPAPMHLSISAGAVVSNISNLDIIERYTVRSKPGYSFSIGFTREFPKGRLQINATYQKGGVSVAAGDINGDGKDNKADIDLDYLTIPVQYQFYLGRHKRFFAGGGGYVAALLSSKQADKNVYEADLKKYDAGATASAGMWLGSHIMLQAGYNYGLIDIDRTSAKSSRNGSGFLQLSYALFSKIKYGPVITIKPKG